MKKSKKLIIIGASAFAEIAYEYFQYDSEYEVIAFSINQEFLSEDNKTLFSLPIVPFEQLEEYYPPLEFYFYAALVYKTLNRDRENLYLQAKEKGYKSASYISSRAFIWRNVEIGEHCFIFEDNTIQPFVSIGDNVVLWSGNHIGHHSKVKDHCFISSHVVISGFCVIGEYSFLAVNSTIADRVEIGESCFLNSGAIVMKSIPADTIMNPPKSHAAKITASKLFKVKL